MTITDFFQQYHDQSNLGNTPENKGQCVGLVELWIRANDLPQIWGNAADIIFNADPKDYNREYAPLIHPVNPGDIVFWNRNLGNGFGHCGIFYSQTGTGFISFDQNWLNDHKAILVNHLWTNILGVLSFKNKAPIPTPPQPNNELEAYKHHVRDLINDLITKL